MAKSQIIEPRVKCPFKKGSRKYQMANPSPRALKRRSNMSGVKEMASLFFVAAMIQTNQIKIA